MLVGRMEDEMSEAYDIAVQDEEFVIRFNKSIFDHDEITRFLDYLELESLRRRSQLTRAQAESLADEIDHAGWQTLKSSFAPS